MSSLVRRLQIRMMKKRGYVRQTQKVVEGANGFPQIIRLKRGEGQIISPAGEPIGRHWPRMLPAA
jgi:hypothetical protein